ncbi:MAG TPA: DUF4406 domain-containing protein [Phycisphaerales bacterium]|nr:DUF4406 domain-containing protein [Phycisphaerales bacterium]
MKTNTRRIYIAGPMTGHAEYNFPAFHRAARRLQEAGWEVLNPAENFGGRTDLPRTSYMRVDLAMLLQCDAVALLEGWQNSAGAKLEYLLARELGLDIIDAVTLGPLVSRPAAAVQLDPVGYDEESILDCAKRLTSGVRNSDYGHPAEDFDRTARMWSGILASKLREGETISALDVPLCMIAVKLAREAHRHKRDNLVDIAGYARTAAMLVGEE